MELKFNSLEEMKKFHDDTFGVKTVALSDNVIYFSVEETSIGSSKQKCSLKYHIMINEEIIEKEYLITPLDLTKYSGTELISKYNKEFISEVVSIAISKLILKKISEDYNVKLGNHGR